jgi:hypothetical protein
MKRSKFQQATGVRYGLARANLSAEQLALVGAVALTYNDVEQLINETTGTAIGVAFDPHQVVSRINGIDGKIAILKEAATHWEFSAEERKALADTLGNEGFALLKKYRDATVHARIFDAETSIGQNYERRGGRSEVLLTKAALEGLVVRLEHLWLEVFELQTIFALRDGLKRGVGGDPYKERLLAELQVAMTRYQLSHCLRLALVPLPEFPEAPDIHTLPQPAE